MRNPPGLRCRDDGLLSADTPMRCSRDCDKHAAATPSCSPRGRRMQASALCSARLALRATARHRGAKQQRCVLPPGPGRGYAAAGPTAER